MAKLKERTKVIAMRKRGMSYSQIKKEINVSKSTLSLWLQDMPLSEKRIRELRADSPKRIEKYRNTMKLKKAKRLEDVFRKASKDIGKLSKRDLFLAGLFLYWGEGTKTKDYSVTMTNTNPAMLKIFIKWLELLGFQRNDLKVKLHLYSDMNIKQSIAFWSKELSIPISQFYKPYIKKTKFASLSYSNSFGKGTCSVILGDRDLWEYVLMSIRYISKI